MVEALAKAERRIKRKKKKNKSNLIFHHNNEQINRHEIIKVISTTFFEKVIKIEVKDNNIEQALRVLKENFKEMGFLK